MKYKYISKSKKRGKNQYFHQNGGEFFIEYKTRGEYSKYLPASRGHHRSEQSWLGTDGSEQTLAGHWRLH